MREQNSYSFIYIYISFLLIACCTLMIQALWNPGSWISNIYVPDSETMYENLVSLMKNDIGLSEHIQGEDARIIYFIYQPLYVLTRSPIAFIFTNISMLSVAAFCTYRAFQPFGYRSAFLSTISLSVNPYILISITGISKEIPLCFLTSILLLVIRKKKNINVFLVSLLCVIAYGVRPAYGVMLACYFLPYLLLVESLISVFQIIMPFTPFLFSFAFSTLAEYLPILKRMIVIQQGLDAGTELGRANLERAVSSLESGGIASCIDLIFRTLANVFSLILRPSFMTENHYISLLGSSYWLYGLGVATSIVATIIFLIKLLAKQEMNILRESDFKYIKNLVFSVIYLVPTISLSLIVQPRYLMPILPISMGILGLFSLKTIYRLSALIFLAAVFGYIYLTFVIGVEPVKSMDSLYKPDFVLSL